jgi:hypothetical protein
MRGSQEVRLFYMNGAKRRKGKHMDNFGHQSSIFPHSFQTCSDIYQTYNEIFQALAVEGDVLLPKPFMGPTPPTGQPQLSPLGLLPPVWKTEKAFPRLVISI